MKYTKLLGLSLILSSSLSVADDNRGWYAGAGVGSTSYSDKDLADDSDTSVTAFGGYRFNRYLALQGNIVSLGEYAGDGPFKDSVEISCVSFTAVGILPIGESGIDLFGRLGFGRLNYTQNHELFGEHSSTGDAIVSSIGANYTHSSFKRMTYHIAVENYYFETGKVYSDNDDKDSHSINALTLGARFNF